MSVLTCERVDAAGKLCGGVIEDGVCGECGRPVEAGSLIAVAVGTSTQAKSTGTRGTGTQARGPGGRSSRRQSSGSTTSRRQSLGGGLVSLPPVPSQDPIKKILVDPQVEPNKRFCRNCRHRVNRMMGFCGNCGEKYDLRPGLKAGDFVAQKYEIKGAIGRGGMGWIYLAQDVVLNRWVVLKGVLDANDAEAAAAAVAERQFLAAVKDGRICAIYDFIAFDGQGYMVLEYLGGRTLDEIRADGDMVDVYDANEKLVRQFVPRASLTPEERGMTVQVIRFGVLAPEVAVAYVLAILPAFAYLHEQGFTHNDVKPDNIMVENDSVKLIDLGAMRRIADEGGTIYGTDGYFAPEAEHGPVAVSDLYSVGRTLAVLLMDFLYKVKREPDATTKRMTTRRMMVSSYKTALPDATEQPVLKANDSLYRFLLRATHEDPDQRFQLADEMEGQLFGILREIVAEKTGTPKPAESRVFFNDGLIDGADREGTTRPLVRLLPALRIASGDVAANEILGMAAVLDPIQRIKRLHDLIVKPKMKDTVEGRLRLADAYIMKALAEDEITRQASCAQALEILDEVLAANEFEWRAHWYAGKALLRANRGREALSRFDRVFFEMPGEIAPRLALGFAAEAAGNLEEAARHYGRVVLVDPGYASACFGLARCQKGLNLTASAVAALEAIPAGHALYTQSRIALAHMLIEADPAINAGYLDKAGETIAGLTTKDGSVERLSARLFARTVDLITRQQRKEDANATLLDKPVTERGMRLAAESAFYAAARKAGSSGEKALWIDMAQRIRPASLF